ncbi:putative adult cuticle protein [Operophtera brumata]|uniref:Putative adult cuticle protein n=1 Tax=Operophtera brumata TaxID=104452 RepID=A0A0L7L4Q8_OPEBR|nr:putative adult cuticle protein [Operophtera brumata]
MAKKKTENSRHVFLETDQLFFQLVCLVALVGAVSAQYGGHGHGHAFSSQHISRHDGPAHVVGHGHHHDYYVNSTLQVKFKYVITHPSNAMQNPPVLDDSRISLIPAHIWKGGVMIPNPERETLLALLDGTAPPDTW